MELQRERILQRDVMRVDIAFSENKLPAPISFLQTEFQEMDVVLDPSQKTIWAWFNSSTSPSFTSVLLHDMLRFGDALGSLLSASPAGDPAVKFIVSGSRLPGTYNLGGDLGFFIDAIRRGDRDGLSAYARECCEMVHHGYSAFNQPVVLIGLIQGDALGGGLEGALSCGVLVAERKARFGMPEILFNLFPGMGAYSLLSRRVGQIQAERMIRSGRIYTAEEMFEMGLVDVLAEDGEGERAAQDYIAKNLKRHGVIQAMQDVRRRVDRLELQELLDVAERWVDLAMTLDESSLKRMERLRQAQARRMTNGSGLAT
jgi:DSF synthase